MSKPVIPIPMLPTDLTLNENLIEVVLNDLKDWCYETKIDGFRIMTCCYPDHIECYTRNGNRVEKLEHYLINHLNWKLFSGYIVDGEVFDTDVRKTASTVRGPNPILNLYYYIFDLIPIKYAEINDPTPLIDRKKVLYDLFRKASPSKYMIAIKYRRVYGKPDTVKDQLFELAAKMVDRGYEGIVIKKLHSPYEHKRTLDWLKVKKLYSLDLRCVGVVESKSHPGILGVIQVDACGTICNVGTGFTYEQRLKFWNNPKLIVGKIVEVRFMERTPAGKLRMPVFVRIRDDKQHPDC